MKIRNRMFVCILTFLLLASYFSLGDAASVVSAAPQTQGSSFEEGESNIWRMSGNVTGYTRGFDNTFARTGARSFAFSSTNTGDAASNNVNIANNLLNNLPAVEVEGGKEYNITFWYFTNNFVKHNTSHGASMTLESFSEAKLASDGNGHLGGARNFWLPEGTTTGWTEYTVQYTTHADANRLRINFGFRASSGEFWIDDVQISPVGEEPEVDKNELATAIAAATAEHGAATTDQYPESAIAQLGLAISAEEGVHGNSAASQTEVDDAVAALNAALQVFRESANPAVLGDRTELAALIEAARQQHNKAQEGVKIGEYPAGSKTLLQVAIDNAVDIRDLENASQSQIDEAEADLTAASNHFAASILTLAEGATRVTIHDLSILAYYYGVDHTDTDNWNKVEMAALPGENEINIRSLAVVARLVINDWLNED